MPDSLRPLGRPRKASKPRDMRYLALIILLIPHVLFAQGMSARFLDPLTISATPDFPEPLSAVSVRVASPSLDLKNASIAWLVDGEAAGEGITHSFVLGAAGSETTIEAVVEHEGTTYRTSRTLRPASVDIVWGADTYVLPLYRGKPLATPGSLVRAEAMPAFVDAGGRIPAEELMYTWFKNGAVLEDASGRGRTAYEGPSPLLFASDTISVEVSTRDGRLAATDSIRITSADPVLELYENHPVFGLRPNATLARSSFRDIEATVTAVPFFAPYPARDPAYVYEWTVNGRRIDTDPNYPNSLTLNAQDSAGDAAIRLLLSHENNIFLSARGSWDLVLRSGPDITDPFFTPQTDL